MSGGQRLLINIAIAIFFTLMLTEYWSHFDKTPYAIKVIGTFCMVIVFVIGTDWVKNHE